MLTRHATIKVLYNDVDISADVSANLIRFDYTDNAGDKADEISISLEDIKQLWRGEWYPSKGAKLRCSIIPDGGAELPCGEFQIDEIEVSGPPSEVTIKAISVPITSPLRSELKTRTWEGADLQKIGAEVAGAAGLSFEWFGGQVPTYQRIDQTNESDLTLLSRVGRELNHRVKVTDGRLVVWDEAEYAQRGPSISIGIDTNELTLRYSFRSKSHDTYSAARVRYHDPVKKQDIEYTHKSATVTTGQTLEINQRVENIDQARKLAEKSLETKNRLEVTGSVDLMGDVAVSAGLVMEITGAGKFNGNYLIDTARHSYSDGSGWTVSADIHRVAE